MQQQQLKRVERLRHEGDWTDYSTIKPIVVGMIGGDGIGPTISAATQRVLEHLLKDEGESGKVRFRVIEGLTIENRAAKMQAIPDDVLADIKKCHVTLKGPTHTPEKGDGWPNIESANVSMRKELDLFANVRAEGFWRLRELFASGRIAIPPDNQLIGELAALRYSYDSQGRILVESKDSMRQRGLPSPDKADALMLAFLEPPARVKL